MERGILVWRFGIRPKKRRREVWNGGTVEPTFPVKRLYARGNPKQPGNEGPQVHRSNRGFEVSIGEIGVNKKPTSPSWTGWHRPPGGHCAVFCRCPSDQ